MTWMIAAYTIIWTAIFIYVFGLDRKQRALASELDQLKSTAEGRDGG
ncbi:MAG: CcmD family protein [Candidatus Krumholzibacteria bacterium]|nr:CcmD family protein [Candidatus Krumholzibacteria bacterium]